LLGDEAALYADAAYSSYTRDRLAKYGLDDQVQGKGYRGNPLSEEDKARNKVIAVTRAGGERPFVISRTRFMGLAKNVTAYGLAAMAVNIRKGAKFLTLYGVPRPSYAGKYVKNIR